MKAKIILTSLVGLAVLNAANAGIDPAKLKNKCLKKNTNYWVEARSECIPKNPCGNYAYRSYCFELDFMGTESQVRLMHKKLIENMQTTISESLPEIESYEEGDHRHFYPYVLEGGEYLVLTGYLVSEPTESMLIADACAAYGLASDCSHADIDICPKVADYASELTQKSCNWTYGGYYECQITCN